MPTEKAIERIQIAIQERLSEIDLTVSRLLKEKEHLLDIKEIYGEPTSPGNVSKSDRYKHVLKALFKEKKSWHITDLEEQFRLHGLDFNKGLIHQCLDHLRKEGEVVAIRVNGSNQKYYYMNAEAKSGSTIKEDYLPFEPKYIESLEIK